MEWWKYGLAGLLASVIVIYVGHLLNRLEALTAKTEFLQSSLERLKEQRKADEELYQKTGEVMQQLLDDANARDSKLRTFDKKLAEVAARGDEMAKLLSQPVPAALVDGLRAFSAQPGSTPSAAVSDGGSAASDGSAAVQSADPADSNKRVRSRTGRGKLKVESSTGAGENKK